MIYLRCGECHLSLKWKCLPKFALANKLYQGTLSYWFHNLTWIEEIVYTKFWNIAHVKRLYPSDNSMQPRIFHRNNCTPKMNAVLTASVLSHTPSDINNLLSVMCWIRKFGQLVLCTEMQNCKFLGILKYKQLTVSRYGYWSITFWYPEDGPLPDIERRVVHDSELNGQKVFAYETVGFIEHPAKYLKSSDNKSSIVLLEKTGVSDLECMKFSDWALTASSLKNNSPTQTNEPDLIINCSSNCCSWIPKPWLSSWHVPYIVPLRHRWI